jgi:heme o synthase
VTALELRRPPLIRRLGAYVALTKPRIIELLLVTTVPAMIVAERGLPSLGLVLATVVGGTLAAGGANATNMVIDRDIDRIMERTAGRPLASGIIEPRAALAFAVTLQVVAFGLLWGAVNLLAAVLAAAAGLFYIFVYSLWLKRSYSSNIVIGGAAGAMPPVIGWAAVTGEVSWTAAMLFLIVFLWTPPHFWALAMRYADDYRAAGVPMLPSVTSAQRTANRILAYSVAVLVAGVALTWVADLGAIYLVVAIVAGLVFVGHAVLLRRDPEPGRAVRVFAYSISYLGLLFLAMAVDELVRSGL